MEITVSLGSRSYPIYIDRNTARHFPRLIIEKFGKRKCALITNNTIANLYRETIEDWQKELPLLVHSITDGEKYKTLETWSGILDFLLNNRLDRNALIIAFGGGVIGDITGFAAASFLRGVDYIQVPTTLLAMVDSSVGGKTAVNHHCGKNLIGAFHQPRMVFMDMNFLNTLPERELISGYAELFKGAFIGGKEMFDFIMTNNDKMLEKDPEILSEGIQRAVTIKAQVVRDDEREGGKRAILNFGHTFAHSLEKHFQYEHILHGEAVLWGMACACNLAHRIGLITPEHWEEYKKILSVMPLPPLHATPDIEKLYDFMFSDKKTIAGTIKFVLPTQPGVSIIGQKVEKEKVLQTLHQVIIHKEAI